MRDAEKLAGVNGSTLMRPTLHGLKKDSSFLFDDLGPDHPMNSAWRGLQYMAYSSQPAVAHWGWGVPKKTKNYLGEPLNRPAASRESEWPMGMTGLRNGMGRYSVENQLEYMGKLQAPEAEMSGMLENVPVSEDLLIEYRDLVGSVRSEGFGRDGASVGKFSFTQPVMRNGRTYDSTIDGTAMLYRHTKGKTLREALNSLFSSPEFAKWENTEGITSDPRKERMSTRERSTRVAMKVVDKLHEYYEDLAQQQLKLSSSPEAKQWVEDLAALAGGEVVSPQMDRELRSTFR